jgi:hypothetical protein
MSRAIFVFIDSVSVVHFVIWLLNPYILSRYSGSILLKCEIFYCLRALSSGLHASPFCEKPIMISTEV